MPKTALLLLLLPLLVGCSTSNPSKTTAPDSPGGAVAEKSHGPSVAVAGREHTVVGFTGYLEIDPYPTGKAVQGTWVHTKDGESYLLAICEFEPFLEYVNKRVTGTGYHYQSSNDPRAQSIGLFKILSLRLADGEIPHATVPTRVPPPPRAHSRSEIAKLPGRWALIVGKPSYELQYPEPGKRAYHTVKSVSVHLADGLQLKKYLWRGVSVATFERLKAARIATLVVRIPRTDGNSELGASRYCEGVNLRCGMDQRPKH